MTREEAVQGLLSDSAHDRLKAARFLTHNPDPADLQALRRTLQSETVSYVRSILELAIRRTSNSESPATAESAKEFVIPPDVREQLEKEITEKVSGEILHEIASPVGLIASAAAREVPDYEHSKTKRHVENLKRVFRAIEQLKYATAVPKPQEFDLAEMLAEIVSAEVEDRPIEVSLYGAKPMLVTSDPTLVRLTISNGIRNAVEAVLDSDRSEPHAIVVTWGATDIDYWAAILDRGCGVIGPVESAFGIGKTTKRGHTGFGLAVARQAIETIGGTCTLQPAKEGGTLFEARWSR